MIKSSIYLSNMIIKSTQLHIIVFFLLDFLAANIPLSIYGRDKYLRELFEELDYKKKGFVDA
jgi:hypothetical protein